MDKYHQTNPPTELKSVVLGRSGSAKEKKTSPPEEGAPTVAEAGAHPEFCPTCKPWIERSRLRWTLCGGMKVGMTPASYVWRLFPEDSQRREEEKTKFLQRLAASARLVSELKSHVTDPEILARMDRYLTMLREK